MLYQNSDSTAGFIRYLEYLYITTPKAGNKKEEEAFKRMMKKFHRSTRDPTYDYKPSLSPGDPSLVFMLPLASNRLLEKFWIENIPDELQNDISSFIVDVCKRGYSYVIFQCNDGKHIKYKFTA